MSTKPLSFHRKTLSYLEHEHNPQACVEVITLTLAHEDLAQLSPQAQDALKDLSSHELPSTVLRSLSVVLHDIEMQDLSRARKP